MTGLLLVCLNRIFLQVIHCAIGKWNSKSCAATELYTHEIAPKDYSETT